MNSTTSSTTPLTLLSLDEAQAELDRLNEEQFVREDGALTAREWQDHWKVGQNKASKLLRKLVACGKMVCYRQPIRDVAGRSNHTFVYKVITDEQRQ